MLHSSDPPSPWDGYRLCLSDVPDCSHLLVIQDDATVARNFAPAIEKVAERFSEHPVVLFLGGFPQAIAVQQLRACQNGERYMWMPYAPIIPLVALLWPVQKAADFMDWADSGVTLLGHPTPRADDGIASQWRTERKQDIALTVPSLVQHLDLVPSVKGGQPAAWGEDPQRKAAVFAEDASVYAW